VASKASVWNDTERLAELITTMPSRKAILDALGLSAAQKNYLKLERMAGELGLELPERWGRRKGAA
jgi:hypothetical protein